MITRMVRGQAAQRALSRLEHPEAILLALILAAAAAIGWVSSVFWLAVAVGVQLAVGGMGAVLVLGAARPGLGLARYATLAAGGVALTVFGRVVVEFGGLLLAPLAALLLWGLLRLELAVARSGGGGWMLDVAMVAIVFAGTAGVGGLVALSAWPPGIVLVVLIGLVPSLRAAEARGRGGAEAVGQAALHLVAVAQVGTAVALLRLPGIVGAALVALAFHAWSGAAEAIDGGTSLRAVVLEFGALALLGLVVALLLHGG